jgi:hypothetical protein
LPKAVTVKFNAGDLGEISQLSLSYSLDGTNWLPATTITSSDGFANLPAGTKALSIAYYNNGWFGACQLIPATKICKEDTCSSLNTITTQWSADGKGECGLTD